MRHLYKILCFVTLALFLLILAQQQWNFVSEPSLTGWFPKGEYPAFSLKSFASGEWQRQMDTYVKTNHGFRNSVIRLYNQFLWVPFGESNNGEVVVGKNRYLFEQYFLNDHYGTRMYEYYNSPDEMRESCEHEVRLMAQLQQLLDERGKKFLFWISPGKDLVYPEKLPTPSSPSTPPPSPFSAYEVYRPLLKEYGINHIDFCSWFRAIKDTVGYDVFPPLGTHWSNLASLYAFDSVMRYLQRIGGAPIPPVAIGERYLAPAHDPDHDLEDLLNIIYTPGKRDLYYADVTVTDTTVPRPKMLIVGDSFVQVVHRNFPFDLLFSQCHFWSYNKIILWDPEHDDVSQVDIAQELAEADYVVIAYCTSQLYNLHQFAQQAVQALTSPSCSCRKDSLP